MEHPLSCPDGQSLRELLLGKLPEADALRLREHLIHCVECRRSLKELKEQCASPAPLCADPLLETAAAHPPDDGSTPTAVEEVCSFLAPAQRGGDLGRLGRYHVLQILGSGGMGVVFEAEDPLLERRVAIKVIRPALAGSPSARERFLREARSAAAIENDHVVPVFDVNIDHGLPYLAMPLLRGETLEARLQREGRLAVGEVVRIGREAAEGLAALHERGLVHRDIKPSNLWLERDRGRVKLLDFGLARAVEVGERLTQQGAVIGTPQYMAPEQARGEPVDARSDLFSLGCVLYRSATGRAPFRGSNMMATLRSLELEHPPPPQQTAPDLPADLSDLIVRMLSKDPAGRPGSASEVIAALTALQPEAAAPSPRPLSAAPASTEATLALPTPRRRRPRVKLLLGLLLLLVLLVPCAYLPWLLHSLWRELRLPRPLPAAPASMETKPAPPATFQYTVRTFMGHEAPAGPVVVSADGKHGLSGAFDGKALLWDLDSGNVERTLGGHVGWVWAVAMSADNTQLLTAGTDRQVQLWKPGMPGQSSRLPGLPVGVGFTPQGPRVLLAAGDEQNVLVLWDVAKHKELRRFEGHNERIHRALISRDGRRILSVGLGQPMWLWDVEKGKQIQHFQGHKGSVVAADLSRDGSKVASGGEDGSVRVWDAATGRLLHKLDGEQGTVECVAFSPDARQVLSGGHDGTLCLWTDMDRPDRFERLKGHIDLVGGVTFLPDGKGALSAGADQSVRLWHFSR